MNFEDIRPYNKEEYHQVITELFEIKPLMDLICNYLPDLSLSEIKTLLLSFKTIEEFQSKMICRVIAITIENSVNKFSYKGLDKLDKKIAPIFITNHRDIVMDSALINYCLDDGGHNTSEIAIGSNLLSEEWIKKLVRINKSFIVKRNLSKQEMFASSKTLSAYINYTIKEKNQSIWIAQQEGRAKDGFDKTAPGLLKMFGMVSEGNLLDHLIRLNITPVSISYELDPCDVLKVNELLKKAEGEEYVKAKGEDEMNMGLGITGDKGNVHLEFGTLINDTIKELKHIKNKNELVRKISEVIDAQIYSNYHLWNSNYVAYDLLHTSTKYINKYDEGGKEKFERYMNTKLGSLIENAVAKKIFLLMYANPVLNAEKLKELN